MPNTYAIYYTPVPFGVEMPQSGNRFIKLQPEKLKHNSELHGEINKDLESFFKIKIQHKLRLNIISHGSIRSLFYNFYHTSKKINKIATIREGFHSYIDTFIETNQKINDLRKSGFDYFSPEIQDLNDVNERNTKEFGAKLKEVIGSQFILYLRAYEHAYSNHNKTEKACRQLLTKMGLLKSLLESEPQGPAGDSFDSTLKTISEISKIVNDNKLTKNEYFINYNQLKEIEHLDISKFAKIIYSDMSAGAAALIDQFSKILHHSDLVFKRDQCKKLLILIDEGDAFLHTHWQQLYIDYLDKTISEIKSKFDTVQVIITTHSPIVMSDFPKNCIAMLDEPPDNDDIFELKQATTPSASFAAPLDMVIRHANNAGSLGSFAIRTIRKLIEDIDEGKEINPGVVEIIDDKVIKSEIERLINERKNRVENRE